MAKRPLLLDGCCCQGGAGMGYHRAGFTVVGVDIAPQPRYPFPIYQRDVLSFIRIHGKHFDAIHVSPPCQRYTKAQRINKNDHPDLIDDLREILLDLGKPYIIENVPGAPLLDPVELCGAMFDLGTYRHRLFESNIQLEVPEHPEHLKKTTKMGRRVKPGEMMHVVGNFTGVEDAKRAMGIDWMNRDGLRESIPPAYTEFIGRQLMEAVVSAAEAA